MKSFQFRLATLLQLRKREEERCLKALAAAQKIFQIEMEKRAKLMQALEDALTRREKLSEQTGAPEAYRIENDFIVGTKVRIIQATTLANRAHKASQKAMQTYLAARRQTMVLQKLEEKERLAHKALASKRDQRKSDELSSIRAARSLIAEREQQDLLESLGELESEDVA